MPLVTLKDINYSTIVSLEDYMKHKKKYAILILAAVLIWIAWTNLSFETTHLTVKHNKIPREFSGFKIAHVADLHNHNWRGRLIDKLEKEKPDVIFIAGDLVDSNHTDIDLAMSFVQLATKIAPIYYVTGNHEAWLSNYSELEQKLKNAGVKIMDDSAEFLEVKGEKVQIVGLQDPDFLRGERSPEVRGHIMEDKLNKMLNPDYYTIVLSHRPEYFNVYADTGANLVLAGHAHGGQFRIPFVGGVIAPDQGIFPKYTSGLYTKNDTGMVVSRGLGNSIIPIRINNRPELVIISLENE